MDTKVRRNALPATILRLASILCVSAIIAAPLRVAMAAAPPKPPTCSASENRQFDFWVGKWDVSNTKNGAHAGSSLIELLYGKCTIRENWSEPGFSGGSLNTYNTTDKRWHQTWTDTTGSWREFVGGLVDGHMVLVWRHPSVRLPGKIVQERMIFTPNADGSVRQYSDQTIDGKNWVERYDYTYRRAKT